MNEGVTARSKFQSNTLGVNTTRAFTSPPNTPYFRATYEDKQSECGRVVYRIHELRPFRATTRAPPYGRITGAGLALIFPLHLGYPEIRTDGMLHQRHALFQLAQAAIRVLVFHLWHAS